MLKLIGIAAIMLSSTAGGLYLSKKYSDRVILLEKIKQMLQQMSINISYRAMTVSELIKTMLKSEVLSDLTFIIEIDHELSSGKKFTDAWQDAITKWKAPLKNEDKSFLIEIGMTLGHNDIDGEVANIAIYQERLSLMLESAREDMNTKGKTTRSLGILAGAFISIMLI